MISESPGRDWDRNVGEGGNMRVLGPKHGMSGGQDECLKGLVFCLLSEETDG